MKPYQATDIATLARMASLADVLQGITSVLNTLYPAVPVYRRKHRLGPVKTPLSGYMNGDNIQGGAFYLVTGGDDPIDGDGATFGLVTDTFQIDLHYVKLVPNQESSRNEDTDVRAKRLAVMTALNVPRLPGVTGALMVGFDSGKPYDEVAGDAKLMASVQHVKYTTFVTRGVAP